MLTRPLCGPGQWAQRRREGAVSAPCFLIPGAVPSPFREASLACSFLLFSCPCVQVGHRLALGFPPQPHLSSSLHSHRYPAVLNLCQPWPVPTLSDDCQVVTPCQGVLESLLTKLSGALLRSHRVSVTWVSLFPKAREIETQTEKGKAGSWGRLS